MKNKILLDAIGQVNDDYISEAALRHQFANKHSGVKWCVMAACLILIISVSAPFIPKFADKTPTQFERLIEYNNAYYSVVDMNDWSLLKNYKLPNKITAQMVGDFIASTTINEDKTALLYEYNVTADNNQTAVYILKENQEYTFVIFCNFLDEQPISSQGMFSVFGVTDSSDIIEIIAGKDKITDRTTIEHFYNSLIKSFAMSEDEYQLEVFEQKSEPEQQAISKSLANEAISIKIITTDALVINQVNYYSSVSFVNWGTYHYKVADMLF